MPSVQLQTYLEARASGATVDEACAASCIGLGEAELHEKDIASGELSLPDLTEEETEMPKTDKTPATDPGEQLIELAADTLRGDVRDSILAWFKAQPKAWSQLGEREQKGVATAIDAYSARMVKTVAEIIARGERPCVVAKLVEYKEKDGVEAKLKLGSTEDVIRALHEACGQEVLLVTTGLENYTGEQAPAEQHVERDQRDLGIGAEYEEAA
jgi:hypothetical protein